ncbi:MAG: aminotransferase class I/II-fold pyridoxal phosphate-dependent enzyme [Proteobacteria bacterium]|nr:aminotransferase class I/II-fold pyridoxal phosphate-dependent enzyme [Pseudomonadota bacterium]
MADNKDNISTRSVHGGEDRKLPQRSLTYPIFQTSTYYFKDTAELKGYMDGDIDREEYGRYGNYTVKVAEGKLAALEGSQACALFSSGMTATTFTLLGMLSQGQHIVMTSDSYRRTRQFCLTYLKKFGIEVSIVPPGDFDAMESAITKNTKIIFSESPTNPYLNVLDLKKLAGIGKKHRVKTIIDATFATPYNQKPVEFGIDLVIHSATKYLGGHNDLLAGAVLGKAPLVDAIREVRGVMGGILDSNSAYLLIRGLKTFALRMERQNATAQAVAEFLESHPKVTKVHYPGLKSHPHHDIAVEQMKGFGGVVSFEVDGGLDAGSRLVDAVRIPFIAPSLGGVESLIEQPSLMSFYELSTEERLAVGIKDNLVRFAVGIEDVSDIIDDLKQALEKV